MKLQEDATAEINNGCYVDEFVCDVGVCIN